MTVQLRWSPSAVAAIRALRGRASPDGFIWAREIIIALGHDLLPGESLLGDAMRNPQTGVDVNRVMRDPAIGNHAGLSVFGIEVDAEDRARKSGARRVGERHVLASLPMAPLQQYAVKVDGLRGAVDLAEVGPAFSSGIAGRWHGLLETSVIIEYQDVREIDWLQESGHPLATIWVPGTVLNELDELSFRGDSERVRDKARNFTRGVIGGSALDQALSATGLPLRDGGAVQIRVWAPSAMTGFRDTDHLEAAFELRERGVPVTVITGDSGLIARAKSSGIETLRPSDRWQLKPEPGPRERELELRLKRAELQKPPDLALEPVFTLVANHRALDIWLTNGPEAGEAKEVTVWWRQTGATNLYVYNRVGGATFGQVGVAAGGRYRQPFPGVLPPGSRDQIAQLTFDSPPSLVEYEIWAAGSHPRLGSSRLVGDEYLSPVKPQ
jgi:hypothetical protein